MRPRGDCRGVQEATEKKTEEQSESYRQCSREARIDGKFGAPANLANVEACLVYLLSRERL